MSNVKQLEPEIIEEPEVSFKPLMSNVKQSYGKEREKDERIISFKPLMSNVKQKRRRIN